MKGRRKIQGKERDHPRPYSTKPVTLPGLNGLLSRPIPNLPEDLK